MRKVSVRSLAAASALCVTAAFSGVGAAGAQTSSGVGTSTASADMLRLQLGKDGSFLDLGLLVDAAKSTIDSAVASPHSSTKFEPLHLSSQVIPGLSALTGVLPKYETRDPGGERSVSASGLNLGNLGGTLGSVTSALPVQVLGGEIVPATLTSLLENGVAKSTLDDKLTDLKVLFGALGVDGITNALGTTAANPATAGTRSLNIGAIELLNLAELLKGLGIDLNMLPLGTVSELLANLKLPVELDGATNLVDAVGTINTALSQVSGVLTSAGIDTSTVAGDIPQVTDILGRLPVQLPVSNVTDVPTTTLLELPVADTIEALQNTLKNLLASALGTLGDTPLLTLGGADISVVTRATDSVATSVADVTAKLNGIKALGIGLPGVDLANVGATVKTVTDTIGGALAIIDPSLRDLVKVSLLSKTTNVGISNGYVRSVAGFDLVNVSINPPALLGNLVGSLTGNRAASAAGILGNAGIPNPAGILPVQGAAMSSLGNVLNLGAVGALLEGASLKVGSVRSVSEHIVGASTVTGGGPAAAPDQQLPRTGGENTRLMAMGALLAAFSLGLRRWVLRPARG